jgi:NAD-dependent deacetylase
VPDTFVILSGAGLSAPSGVPTFRDANGLWEGHRLEEVATPGAWARDAELVRRFYDDRRVACEAVAPNPGHHALALLQRTLGPDRVILVTQNVDGLLTRAGAADVIEMHGTLWRVRCEHDTSHRRRPQRGRQDPLGRCECGGRLRPDIVWFGETPDHLDRIFAAIRRCTVFVSVGTSGVVYPAAGLVVQAWLGGAHCLEVNPAPSGGRFHEVVVESADAALPRLVQGWL